MLIFIEVIKNFATATLNNNEEINITKTDINLA